MILSCPGKTFLLGEYLALDGGPSILLTTSPRFELHVQDGAKSAPPFHPESPAGKYFSKHSSELSTWNFEFRDPYQGLGGLGASSAQFALLYAFHHNGEWKTALEIPYEEMLREYRECAWSGEGIAPSGADVVAQMSGGVTWFDGRNTSTETWAWPFEGIGFTLIRTGHKLATHEHLKEGAQAPHAVLRTIVLEARKAFETADEMRLIESINAGALVLRQSGLTATATTDLLDQMRDNHELFWAAKGCGAMGADIVLAIHPRSRTQDVVQWAKGRGLEVCATHENLTSGLETSANLRGHA